jgi:CheY-like chemotaxis protein
MMKVKPLTILVVEDDKDFVKMAYEPLEKYYVKDVAFTYAYSGEEAVAQLSDRRFDVLLLDLDLAKGHGELSGRNVLDYALEKRPRTAVVVVTGTETQGLAASGGKTFDGRPVREVVGKPISHKKIEELLENIRKERSESGRR